MYLSTQTNTHTHTLQTQKRVETLLKQRLRDVYRATWSCSRDRAYVASRVPQLMIWSDRELHNNYLEILRTSPELLRRISASTFLHMCRQLYWEYQRQLWMPEFGGAGGVDEFHLQWLNTQAAVFFADAHACRLTSRSAPNEDDVSRATKRQQKFLRDVLRGADELLMLVVAASVRYLLML